MDRPIHRPGVAAVVRLGAVLMLSLTACRAETPPTSRPPAAPASGGISFEEWRRNTPPAPQDLSAERTVDGIRLAWSPPPAPDVSAPRYALQVATYRVFRIGSGEQEIPIGETRATTFLVQGASGRFAVRAVMRSGTVGERSAIVTAP